ncbi:hypothetical protein HH308_03020 [Gordonia sp. TBRC 11910]|uniref:Uncharacterized protein n=1 Tax=Gordonia asplenii TaxID=2725283 RepID=A0A848KUL9_9ACTN|nr:hypothetical protein [Gordonia asplenii]NMO00183.1 hypothetical protein [Gordonia asplenii]
MTECRTAVPADNHLTVGQLVDATPLGKILDTPVADVLAGLKLPALPALPQLPALPGLPTLPALNFDVLLKPLTDLLNSFGTGNLSTAAIDPSKVLSVLSQLLESTLSMSSAALRALDGLWSGSAATSATAKTAKTGAETTALATQGSGMSIDVGAAASIVAAGLATLQGIVVKTVGLLASTIPLIATPIGQGMALAFITTGVAEGTAAVAATRAQLLGPTTHMAANGTPVKISGAPSSSTTSPFAVAANALDAVGTPLKTISSSLTQALGTVTTNTATTGARKTPTTTNPRNDTPDTSKTKGDKTTACPDGKTPASTTPAGLGGGVGGGAGALGGVAPGVAASTPLSARPTTATVSTAPASLTATTGAVTATSATTASTMPAAMGPMMAGGLRTASGGSVAGAVADHLITQANGAHLVGEPADETGPAVLGDEPQALAADIDLSLIDIGLNLGDTPLRM